MEKDKLQEYKDSAWKAKTENEWKEVMLLIKAAVENDPGAATYLRNYCKGILPKKREWWEKSKNRPVINKAPVFRDDVQDEMKRAFTAIANYYESRK